MQLRLTTSLETNAEIAAPKAAAQMRQRAPRGPRKLPDNLLVERVVESAPYACDKCGGLRLRQLGQVTTKTLECDPDEKAVDLYAR
jgi:transposase